MYAMQNLSEKANECLILSLLKGRLKMDRLTSTTQMINTLGNKMILNQKGSKKSCKYCISYMKCFMNQIGIGADKFAGECSFYNS